ncbi:hypothetical protein ACN4EG_02920 [Alkalinema pantanalense CENA528]|uniref:hypothetical protein n=1 Tax=Alkalinema pantanalense TaxID=1620705 RepID=UPI003D6F5592
MGGLINFFKSLIGGIFGFIGGLFGGKKGAEGFYMDAGESAPSESTAAAAPAEAAATEAAPANAGSARAAKLEALNKAKADAAPAATPAATLNLPEPTVTEVKEVAFATKYLTPMATGSRRRPGPSLGAFRDMAKSMKA